MLTTAERMQAAAVIQDASSYFCLAGYAEEGLQALEDAGWTITPPSRGLPASDDETPTEDDATVAQGIIVCDPERR